MRSVLKQFALALAATTACAGAAAAQASYPCVNQGANPYKLQQNWMQTPRPLASTNAVAVDAKDNVWIFDRCGEMGCSGTTAAPIFCLAPPGSAK